MIKHWPCSDDIYDVYNAISHLSFTIFSIVLNPSAILNRTFVTYSTFRLILVHQIYYLSAGFTYLTHTHNFIVTATINTVHGSNLVGVEIFRSVQAGAGAQSPAAGGVPVLFWGYSDRSILLTAHLLLMPACKWLGATPTPHIRHGETSTFSIINTASVPIHYNYSYYYYYYLFS